MFLIQIVGRLVQKQDIRLLQKQLAKQNLGSLTTTQICNITFQSDIQKKQVKKPAGAKPGFVVYYTNYSLMAEPSLKGVREV